MIPSRGASTSGGISPILSAGSTFIGVALPGCWVEEEVAVVVAAGNCGCVVDGNVDGAVVGFAREGSTTDVAAELTNLIQTQRAYSSNAKVIQTVDEMLQETTNIKR